ncbi:MAG: cupin-like domain-containing protein [Myxococcota bacterium]
MVETGTELAPPWRRWVVDNLLRGASRDELTEALEDQGVPTEIAATEVEAAASSPLLEACAHLAVTTRRRDQLLALLGELRRYTPIERRARVAAEPFFRHYWSTSTPVVLTSQIDDWPALRTWSFATLRDRVGSVTIEACTDRDRDPFCDRNFARHRETMTMADYLDRVEAGGLTNDHYMIAHNRTMDRPGMATLFDDIVVDDEMFNRDEIIGGCTLWVGPGGTCTPLHHDSTNILFCQITGRKRFWLIPPWEPSLLDDADGFYARFDPAEPRSHWPECHAQVRLHELVLEPGEALFLPAGWWHQVRALEASISFSLLCFRRPNRFDQYAPGKVRVAKTTVEPTG